ncbi:hypothetical protein Glove_181g10 [Diversispora epigaea]|uniref:Uncharacterized protein n=1 Tax=Diversispora epigaea TaxID=1348612 RepID=A0A397IXD6_9GLOM|nr:hypothetical protein Glove_181g10 [Diversispora epigaea]
MSSELDLLRQENAKLMGENTVLIVKIVELEQTVKEKDKLMARIVELERYKTDTINLIVENVELKDRITKLEQKQTSVITNEQEVSPIKDISPFIDKETITSDFSPEFPIEPKSLEEREVVNFIERVDKENTQETSSDNILSTELAPPNLSYDITTVPLGNDQNSELLHVTKTVFSGNDQIHIISDTLYPALLTELNFPENKVDQAQIDIFSEIDDEIDKNQIVEQGELETRNFASSAQHLSCLFKTAIKSRQQEILNWYYYSLEFKNGVHNITTDGKIKDKIARTMIYKEIKPFLPIISQDNLRKKTLRARKLLMLFGENGVKSKTVPQGNDQTKKILPESKKTLPEANVISEEVTPETKVSTSNKSRPPISVLLSDPEKKQKHIIEMH